MFYSIFHTFHFLCVIYFLFSLSLLLSLDVLSCHIHLTNEQHDPEQCTPGGEDGNYIMFARATSGDKRNNNKFSPCSLKAIEPVLNAKARSGKGCFTGTYVM